MRCRLRTRDELIEWAVNLPGEQWAAVTTQVAWLHRRGGLPDDVPVLLEGVADIVIDSDEWIKVRKDVKRLRTIKYRKERTARLAAAEERRRLYMRSYMARRRRRKE